MEAAELVVHNHDVHLHTKHHSDGWHTFEEVAAYALRWLQGDPWVGVSDHSPLLENVLAARWPAAEPNTCQAIAGQIRRSSLAMRPTVQQAIDSGVRRYVAEARRAQQRIRETLNATLLVGLEVDCYLQGPSVTNGQLASVDYVLMAYHGRHIRDGAQAERFLVELIQHPFADVLAHPDTFLGPFDIHSCDWGGIFQQMAHFGVLCEYNLTTPLPQDLLETARDESLVQFVIGSDLHDFRKLSTRRIMDAWGESEGGGFELARDYLMAFLRRRCSRADLERCQALFDTRRKLAALESKIYARGRRFNAFDLPLSEAERRLLECLDAEWDDALDRQFLEARLRRFSSLPAERIVSTMAAEEFLTTIQANRELRRS